MLDPLLVRAYLRAGAALPAHEAGDGTVGVQAAYFPELFGSRYRYAGVAIGREFSYSLIVEEFDHTLGKTGQLN